MSERDEEITIDLVEMWHAIRKNKNLVFKTTAGCLAAAALYLAVVPPTYESTALLRIKQPKGIASSMLESVSLGNVQASQQLMSTYAEILKSRGVVVPVIEATEEADDDGLYPRYEDYIEKRVATNPYKDTEIMQVTVNAETPEDAQKANQMIVNGFLNRLTELTRGEQKATREFIEERVGASKEDLSAAEDKLTEFKKENKVLEPTSQVKMAADKLSMADKLRAENQIALESAKARNGAATSQLNENSYAISDNSVIKEYQKQLAGLEAKRIEYLDKYTEDHPDVIDVNNQIAETRSILDTEIAKVASLQAPSDNTVYQGLLADKFKSEAEIAVAEGNLAAIQAINDQYNADVEELSETEKEYLALMRDEKVSEEIYVMLAKRLEEAKVAEVAVSNDVQVVDTPTLPEKPVAPKKARTLLVALMLGILGSSAFIVARELLNRTVKTADDVTKYLELPVLGSVPDYASLKKNMDKAERGDDGIFAKLRRLLWKKD